MKLSEFLSEEDTLMKEVKVNPSATQLSKGAATLDGIKELSSKLMEKLSAKEKRIICLAIYKSMVGNPQA